MTTQEDKEQRVRVRSSYEIDEDLKPGLDKFVSSTRPLSKVLAAFARAPEEYAAALQPLLDRDLPKTKKSARVDKTAERLLGSMGKDELAALVAKLQQTAKD